ncbi:MAG: aminoglycoside phosphotransferase family protein [Anaerolineales bacterium]|nr:aminoglycoside phosphotransferase family protein [Anaerolineales bacterium]
MEEKMISLDQPLARGRTADIFEWDDGRVLKLFHDWFSLENIEYEFKMARAVHESGVKSPNVLELVKVQGRNGLVYERVRGDAMTKQAQQKPWMVFRYARELAKLHAQMHECVSDANIPKQREKLKHKLQNANALPVLSKVSLLKLLEDMPDGDKVCHGDFHPDNVLLTESDSTIIDWIDSSSGNPLADVARTSIILLGAANSQIPNLMMKIFVRVFHSAYLRAYFRLKPGGYDEYRRWLPIVAGARLSENIPELETWLIEQAEKKS